MFLHYTTSHPNQLPIATSRTEYRLPSADRPVTQDDLEVIDLNYLYCDSIHKAIVIQEYMRENGFSDVVDEDENSREDVFDNEEAPKEIETINLVDDDIPDIQINEVNTAEDPLSIEQIEPQNKEIQFVAKDNGFDLFRCGTTGCRFATDSMTKFKEHLFYCDVSEDGAYKCVHCEQEFKYSSLLVDHIEIHASLRFVCSVCDHKAPFEQLIIKHMKVKHKIHTCKLVPNDNFFIALPNNKSALQQTMMRSESYEDKFCFEPEECEKLPRMAIYSQERKCAKCGYSSKVRTNIYRHLQAHLNDAPVPETAPVNPVPCLEKNEKMFDKMLNLANSSFSSSSRMGGKTDKNLQPNSDNNDLPAFVPASKRYVCGALGCNYLTHDDSMLKCHFNALHSDEVSYKCPHCKLELSNEFGEISVEKIGFHLRMHDLYLYKCSVCDFLHYQRHKIEKHLQDKHPNKMPYIHVIRELDNSANLEGEHRPVVDAAAELPVREPRDDKVWKCNFCRYRSQTESEMKTHTNDLHGIDSQFKCSLCSFKCDSATNFTEHATTHGNPDTLLLASYYKTEFVEKSSTNTSDSDSFDTTPLWKRDTTRVKHIRGILIEDSRSPKKSSTKASLHPAKTETVTKDLFNENSQTVDTDLELTNIELPDIIVKLNTYGKPIENKFSCPFCKKYETPYKKMFYSHLCKELSYPR